MRSPHNLAAACIALLMILTSTLAASAVPQLPEPELTWKNVNVGARKTVVFSMYRDSRGIMWVGSNNGLYFYDGINTHAVGTPVLAGSQIYSIIEHDGHLLLGGNNGLHEYDMATGAVTQAGMSPTKEIRSMLLVDNHLWIGSLYGIFRLDLADGSVTDFSESLPHKSVYSLLRDTRGILYAGTYNGLARWNQNRSQFVTVEPDINIDSRKNLFINSLLESPDCESIYIGTEGALYEFSPLTGHWTKIGALTNNNVKSLATGRDGHLLVGTNNGVYDISNETATNYRHDSRDELSLSDNEIWCIYADSTHNIWTGHERGLSIAANSSAIRTIKLSTLTPTGEGNEIYSIYRDSGSNLWLGGTNGALRLTGSAMPQWYRHDNSGTKSLSHNRIRNIYEDSRHNIWLSTDASLNRFNPATCDFDIFNIVDSNGEHNSTWVYSFVETDKYVWVGSFLSGIHGVEKSKLEGPGTTIVADFSLNTDKDRELLANDLINNLVDDRYGNVWILLFRDNHLTRYDSGARSHKSYDIRELTGEYPTQICSDHQGRIWCAFKGGVVLFDGDKKPVVVKFPDTHSDESVLAMGAVGDGVWISTISNVWKVDGSQPQAALLPIPQKSYTAIYDDTTTGKVLLGGTDEIIEVDRKNLGGVDDFKTIKLVLHENADHQLAIDDPTMNGSKITIPYGGSITLVVSSLDYSPDAPQRYMYKLSESSNDTIDGWVVMPKGSNTIALSDLKMGSYNLLIKNVGSPIEPTSIKLTVERPVALSWWAICIYITVGIGVIVWVVWLTRRRNLRHFNERERQTALENVERRLTFLSTISHDLKTPLSMILGPASLMKEHAGNPEDRKNLQTIYDNAVRLNNMIHRTLELQQIDEADENLLIMSTIDVVEFCKGVFEVFKENNPGKTFIFHSSSRQLLIEADAVKLESVLTNLLSNSCKYSNEGATISLGITTDDTNVEIIVSDDGVGISDIDQPLVFQRMFRSPDTATLHEGTGLGLYLIKKYLEAMKGSIDLYSKKGQGTTFVVTLPMTDKTLPVSDKPHSDSIDSDKAKILIVEDNRQISAFIAGMLHDRYTCFEAENGRAGLAIAASVMPDLIIADEMMPIMSGLDMMRRLKQNPRLSSIPTIMLTAKDDNATESDSIKLGVDVFMTKPFEPSALLGRIAQLLKGRHEIKEKIRVQTIAEAQVKPIEAESASEKALARIARAIEDNISDPDLNVNMLCEKTEIPNKQLYRLIKKYMGIAPLDYIRRVRLQKAAVLLSQHRFTVSEISYMVGFKTPSYFAKCFTAQYGVKPSQYISDDEAVGKN